MEIRYSLFKNNGAGGGEGKRRVKNRRKVIEPLCSMIGKFNSRIDMPRPTAWIRHRRKDIIFPSMLKMSEPTVHNI